MTVLVIVCLSNVGMTSTCVVCCVVCFQSIGEKTPSDLHLHLVVENLRNVTYRYSRSRLGLILNFYDLNLLNLRHFWIIKANNAYTSVVIYQNMEVYGKNRNIIW